MARAISGGAVYVSDKPGEHDFELLKALVLEDGSVLRALLPGRPTRDALFAGGWLIMNVGWGVCPVEHVGTQLGGVA